MDSKEAIEKLISEFDIKSEIGRKLAYTKCVDYAKENLKSPKDFNSFVAEAAKMLDQIPIRKDVAAASVPASCDEKLHLTYTQENGPILTGNKTGLLYLSRLLANLADSDKTGEHTHLYYGEFPMYGQTFPLTIYLEDDFWLFKHANVPPETEKVPMPKQQHRNIEPDTIIAFAVLDNVPPTLPILRGNIYKVVSCSKYKDQNALCKGKPAQDKRYFVFEFAGNNGNIHKIAFDIDDSTVFFITKNDVKKLVSK
jgi:hypothetical protein